MASVHWAEGVKEPLLFCEAVCVEEWREEREEGVENGDVRRQWFGVEAISRLHDVGHAEEKKADTYGYRERGMGESEKM